MKVRRFENHDWDGFAGAENFDDGSAPFEFEAEDYFGVADKGGIQIYRGEEGEETWNLDLVCFPAFTEAVLKTLFPEKFSVVDLMKIGFKKIL